MSVAVTNAGVLVEIVVLVNMLGVSVTSLSIFTELGEEEIAGGESRCFSKQEVVKSNIEQKKPSSSFGILSITHHNSKIDKKLCDIQQMFIWNFLIVLYTAQRIKDLCGAAKRLHHHLLPSRRIIRGYFFVSIFR